MFLHTYMRLKIGHEKETQKHTKLKWTCHSKTFTLLIKTQGGWRGWRQFKHVFLRQKKWLGLSSPNVQYLCILSKFAFVYLWISAHICPSVEAPGSLACDAPGWTNWPPAAPTRSPTMPKARKIQPPPPPRPIHENVAFHSVMSNDGRRIISIYFHQLAALTCKTPMMLKTHKIANNKSGMECFHILKFLYDGLFPTNQVKSWNLVWAESGTLGGCLELCLTDLCSIDYFSWR